MTSGVNQEGAPGALRDIVAWVDQNVLPLLITIGGLLPFVVVLPSTATVGAALVLVALMLLLLIWTTIRFIRDVRHNSNSPLVRAFHRHGHRAWWVALAFVPLAGLVFLAFGAMSSTSGLFWMILEGAVVTLQLWAIVFLWLLLVASVLHLGQKSSLQGFALASALCAILGLGHLMAGGAIMIADPSASDFLFYALPMSAALLILAGMFLSVGLFQGTAGKVPR